MLSILIPPRDEDRMDRHQDYAARARDTTDDRFREDFAAPACAGNLPARARDSRDDRQPEDSTARVRDWPDDRHCEDSTACARRWTDFCRREDSVTRTRDDR